MAHELPELPYAYDSLEPYIDEETMRIHHDKHHQAYLTKFLKAIENYPELQDKPVEEILSDLENVSEQIRNAVVNNGGGYYHHSIFWEMLSKDKPFNSDSNVGQEIIKKFGSFENFKEQFSNAAATQFGSGWAWLVMDKNSKQIDIMKTPNQNSPISEGKIPLLGIDIWEHAYYLKYQNQRPKYIEAFFNVINWERIDEFFTTFRDRQ
jgi:Fe-Mn family superoxide dismutase